MSSSRSREPISKVDTTWLRMEQPTNLMMITGVIALDDGITFDRLVDTVSRRFLSFRRFRQKAVDGPGGAWWEDDRDFDILNHIRRAALPGKADREELEAYVSDLSSTPLEQSRPLWCFHYVENYNEGPVIVTRLHHCYADGIALVQVMLTLTDESRVLEEPRTDPRDWKRQRQAEPGPLRRIGRRPRHWSVKLFDEGVRLLLNPDRVFDYVDEAGELARELVHSVSLPDDPRTLYKGSLGTRKKVAWADPLPLDEVKAVSRVLGCTVNDVLIAAVAGALRNYMISRGETPSAETEIRATVPVNLRPLEHAKELGNHFGVVFLSLPIGEANPIARVYQVHRRMNQLKNSKQAAVAFGLLAALGMGPSVVQKPALDMLSEKASMVLTNVPGPQKTLYLAGGRIREMMFWVPQNGSIGMGVSIISYNGNVYFGLITDSKIVAQPREVIMGFKPQFDYLLQLGMMLPLDERPDALLAEELLDSASERFGL